jgi:hypothetical protein
MVMPIHFATRFILGLERIIVKRRCTFPIRSECVGEIDSSQVVRKGVSWEVLCWGEVFASQG